MTASSENTSGDKSAESRLQVLLLDYEMARDDDRSLVGIQATILGVAVALVALLMSALTQECKFNPTDNCVNVPDPALAAAPLLPIGMLAFIQIIGTVATVRSYYMRALEAELASYAGSELQEIKHIRPMSFTYLATEVNSLRRGRLGYRILNNYVMFAIVIVFGGIIAYIGFNLESKPVIAAMIIVYSVAVGTLAFEMLASTVRGPSLFRSAVQGLLKRGYRQLPTSANDETPETNPSKHSGAGRSLASYISLPRPEDLVKWPLIPLIFIVGAMSSGQWGRWEDLIVLWLTFEYLIYMARYQLNDIRGYGEDIVHAERASRARLPLPDDIEGRRRTIAVSLAAILARLFLAALIGWAFELTRPMIILIVLVIGITIPYEVLRSQRVATPFATTPTSILIWLSVGLGYVLRGGLALHLAGFGFSSSVMLVGISYLCAFGIMFVLLTWVLDASSYCRVSDGGTWYARSGLERKPHLACLLGFVGVRISQGQMPAALAAMEKSLDKDKDPEYAGNQRILADSAALRVATPWTLAFLVATGLSAWLGVLLAEPQASATTKILVVVLSATVSIFGALIVLKLKALFALVLLVVISLVLALIDLIAQPVAWQLAPLPWIVTVITYINFRQSSYRDLKLFGSRAKSGLRDAGGAFLRFLMGGATWDALKGTPERAPSTEPDELPKSSRQVPEV